ncbi:protein-tyrosine phosphatase-like protein [Thermothelomyces heterothallicus CBS 202.75]|uniref:protein-tyrosine phosphatase-like protein n=1 Tax=Thermothelomyces heterothallicus CBS 202.75 TaxID=1149848 RepID=UPI003743FE5C
MDGPTPTLKESIAPSFQSTVFPTAPYSSRPPSPPYIHVPPPMHSSLSLGSSKHDRNGAGTLEEDDPDHDSDVLMTIRPSPSAVHTAGLTQQELYTVTQGLLPQSARDGSSTWVYESRRRAQQVLSYLYLGPASAVKDRAFLEREGITMVLCARDARFATAGEGMLVGGVRRAVEGMGVDVEGIDVADGRALVGAFPVAAAKVNQHLLAVAARAGVGAGRVLVVCETGNDRSAAVVAAYLMAMYGLDTVQAVQFMQLKRFCVALGDDFRFQLQTYGDILRARGDVGATGGHHHHHQQQQQQQGPAQPGEAVNRAPGTAAKRRIEQTMGETDEGGEGGDMSMEIDDERYEGRSFAPFVDRSY